MAECSKCGKQEMTFTCRYCGEKFCSEHRLPENHDCQSMDEVKTQSGEGNDRWFKKKDVKKETVHGSPKKPHKPSIINDVFDTLTNSVTLSIILITSLAFLVQNLVPNIGELMVLSPAITDAAVTATNNAVGQEVLTSTLLDKPWSILTVMLVHGGTLHIFANMVTFYFFGSVLERKISRKEMLKFYIGSGLVASIAIIAFSNILFQLYGPVTGNVLTLRPAVGASGAVVAVFGAVAMLYPKAEVLLYFIIPMKIRTALYLFAGVESMNMIFKLAGITLPIIGNFASSAHLAGLLVGVWYGRKLRDRFNSQMGVLDLFGY